MKAIRLLTFLTAAVSLAVSVSAQEQKRVRILVDGSYNSTSLSFTDSSTFASFLEEGSSRRSYDAGKGVVFEGGAIFGVTRALGVMGSVELYESDLDGRFEESLPHPLYFNEPRVVSGEIPGLQYKEKAVHLDGVFTRAFSSFTVDLFGGPSFFFTNTEILNAVDTTSSYPFDEAVVTGTSNVTLDDNPIGFNAGGALTWGLSELFGVAFQARYSQATIRITRDGGQEVELDAGGFRVGGGIRLSF